MTNSSATFTITAVMKKDLHPTYYKDAQVTCSCGNTFTVGATVPQIQVGVCDQCHPFWTGVKKLIDSEGLADRFARRQEISRQKQEAMAKKQASKQDQKQQARPKSFKEMMDLARAQLKEEKSPTEK